MPEVKEAELARQTGPHPTELISTLLSPTLLPLVVVIQDVGNTSCFTAILMPVFPGQMMSSPTRSMRFSKAKFTPWTFVQWFLYQREKTRLLLSAGACWWSDRCWVDGCKLDKPGSSGPSVQVRQLSAEYILGQVNWIADPAIPFVKLTLNTRTSLPSKCVRISSTTHWEYSQCTLLTRGRTTKCHLLWYLISHGKGGCKRRHNNHNFPRPTSLLQGISMLAEEGVESANGVVANCKSTKSRAKIVEPFRQGNNTAELHVLSTYGHSAPRLVIYVSNACFVLLHTSIFNHNM